MYLRSVANGNLQRSPQPLISIDWTSCPRSCCLNCVELAVALGTGVALRLTVASNRASCGNRDHLAVITHPNDSALEFVWLEVRVLPAPPRNLLGALYAALRIETPTYKRCDGGAMYHQEKGEAFSATAPYLSLGGTEQSTRWRNPMGKSGRSNKKGRPNKRTKRLMKLEEKRRRNASRRKSVRP